MSFSTEMYSHEAEIGLLSILMKNPESIYNIADLTSDMFSSEQHKVIFNAISELALAGNSTDVNTIISHLQMKGSLERAGTQTYIYSIFSRAGNVEDLPLFVQNIVGAYKASQVIKLASIIPSRITKLADVDGAIQSFRKSLDDISKADSISGTIDIKYALEESWKYIKEKQENPDKVGIATGIKPLDSITGGYHGGELWFIAARPSHGKSALMLNSVATLASRGIPTLVFSLEMSANALMERMLSIKSGIPLLHIRLGKLEGKEISLLKDVKDELSTYPVFIDTNFNINVPYYESTIRKYHHSHGIKVVFLDYIQLLAERGNEATHELGRISRTSKMLANDLDITNIVLSQVNRNCEMRDDKRPIMADLRQSGNLEEDADIIAVLYRDAVYNRLTERKDLLEFILRKHRNGPIGMIPLNFKEDTTAIYGN